MRISDWSSDVCSSDLHDAIEQLAVDAHRARHRDCLEMPQPGLVWIGAREQRRARATTACGIVELGEAQPALGEPVEVGRRDFTPVADRKSTRLNSSH